ncbi:MULTISPECIES: DUF459 domain-containing protein [Planktothrix]|uniref:SGNH/GDSL hydrolase family protein n=1 Tax=Planktothrix TaxID=54304 RepID=UPI0003F8DD03|nr:MULTISPECIES: DUF459 domain-containing protein [Planktothrix]
MKDREFLLLVCLVSLTLIFSNFSLFLKSIASSSFLQPTIKQAAQQLKLEGFRQTEQAFWNQIKDVNLDQLSPPTEIATLNSVAIFPESKPIPDPSPQPTKIPISSPPIKPKPQPEKPYTRFLFVGDSIMFDLGIKLQSSLRKTYQISNTKLDYKPSSGLNRIDYYNWYNRTSTLIKSYQPDVIVVLFGGNEGQDITDINGRYQRIFTKEWEQAYQERVERYAKLLSNSSVRKVYWVGQPMSRKPRYNRFFSSFNKTYQEVSKSYPKIEYISTWEVFASGGKYAAVVADKSGKHKSVKINDGVHFTSHGANIISEVVLEEMKKDKIITLKSKPPKTPPSPAKLPAASVSESPRKKSSQN